MPTSRVHSARSVAPAAKASRPTKASASKLVTAKAKTSNSPSAKNQEMAGKVKASPTKKVESPSALINAKIEALGDWRGEMLSRLRALIKQADPEVVEEWKWSVPVWSHVGII